MPKFICVIDYSHLTLVLVECKELNNFNLQIKVEKFRWIRHSKIRNLRQLADILIGEHRLAGKASNGPLSQISQKSVFVFLDLDRLTEEGVRAEFLRLQYILQLLILTLEVKRE